MEEIDKNKEYKIYSIKNCKIYTDGTHDFAVIKENNIIKEPSYQYRFLKDAYKNSSIKDNCVFERGTPKIKKKYNGIVASMLTGGGGNYNYFHWLFDVLPRLKILNEYTNIENINYFLFYMHYKSTNLHHTLRVSSHTRNYAHTHIYEPGIVAIHSATCVQTSQLVAYNISKQFRRYKRCTVFVHFSLFGLYAYLEPKTLSWWLQQSLCSFSLLCLGRNNC